MPPESATQPPVSVIVPVYNVEDFVGECVDSLLGQSLAGIELIFVDDASTDASLAIVEAKTKDCPRVRIIRQPHNQGVGAARNLGIEAARGEYLKIIDSDDVLELRALEDLYCEARAHDADIVFHDAVWWHADGSRKAYPYPERHRAVGRMHGHAAWWYLFRRSIVAERPELRFPVGAHPHEDTTFSFMLFSHCRNGRYLPQACLAYRQHDGMVMRQVETTKRGQYRRSAALCLDALLEFYKTLPLCLKKQRRDAFFVLSAVFFRMAGAQQVSPGARRHFRMRRVRRFLHQSKRTASGRLLVKVLGVPVFLWPLGSGKAA